MELMFYIYLACLFFGGILTTVSIIAGGDDGGHDAHGDLDSGHDFDSGHSLDSGHDFDAGHSLDTGDGFDAGHDLDTGQGDIELSGDTDMDLDHSDGHVSHEVTAADAVKFVSFRNAVFFTTFFGMTGTIFNFLNVGQLLTFGSATGMGLFAAWMGYRLMKYLRTSESGEGYSMYNLKGKNGTVTIPVSKSHRGKIRVRAGGQTHEILAKASQVSEIERFNPGDNVLIIEYKNNTAYVVHNDL